MSRDFEPTAAGHVDPTHPGAPFDEEFPSIEAPGARRRLFTILAWAGGGFAAVAALSLVLAGFSDTLFGDVGIGSAAVCVGIGLVGFVAVVAIARELDEHHRVRAQVLFWVTTIAYAVLINVFAAAFNFDGSAETGFAFVAGVALAVAGVGAAVLGALAIAIVIGFENPFMLFVRWGVFIALVAVPVWAIDPELWWAGLIAGFLLAVAVETTINEALRRWHVPEPALAACLVAGVTAVVLLVIYVVVRFVLRLVAGIAQGAANS